MHVELSLLVKNWTILTQPAFLKSPLLVTFTAGH